MSSDFLKSETNELAQELTSLRSEWRVTQEQLRDDAARRTQTEPINVGTIRNCEGDLRPTKLATLRRCWYFGLSPRMEEQRWLKVLLKWALKKDQEALDLLESERAKLAKDQHKKLPKPLDGKAYSYAEAIGLLGLAQVDDETDQQLRALLTAAKRMKPQGLKLLTEFLEKDPEFLAQQLKVLAPAILR